MATPGRKDRSHTNLIECTGNKCEKLHIWDGSPLRCSCGEIVDVRPKQTPEIRAGRAVRLA